MKRQIPLKWKLTASMLGIWLFVIAVFIFFYNRNQSKLDVRYTDLLTETLLAKASMTANDVAFEVAAGDEESTVAKLRDIESKTKEIELVAVLDAKKAPKYLSNNRKNLVAFAKTVKKLTPKKVHTIGDRMAIIQPISPDEGVIGYVLILKDLKAYHRQRVNLTWGILLMGIMGTVFAAGAAYFVGHSIAKPIHNLVSAAERIADGDLTHIVMDLQGSHEITRLASTIQKMAEAMRFQVMAIKTLTREIADISKETEGTMTNLASSAAQQAAAVNETAATVEEMERAGQSSAGNAKQIVVAAEKTAEASLRGRRTVEKTYEIIMQIKDDSQDISEKSKNLLNSVEEVGNIIQSVNSIAEQSKILAVNASIEAAKAGEFGSGSRWWHRK